MLPEKIGIYEIKSELGRGGMATVYRGYDSRFEREVAVKVLPPEMLHADPQFRLRFEREAKIIAQLEHPSIVPVYDVGEDNHQPYFVMRYMPGGSLSDRIKAGPMSVAESLRILEQVAPGLDEAHSKGIIHRDLKPSNILFDSKGSPYISDFGIAKISQGSGSMTGSGIIGTPAYMAPEQATGDPVDGRADVYALGIILFEMLTGQQPYQADTPMAVAIKHVTDPVPRILTINPKLPEQSDIIIQTAMAKNREERFTTAVDMVNALKELVKEQTTGQKSAILTALRNSAVKTVAPTEPKKRSPVIAIVVILGLILVGGGYFVFGRNSLPFGLEPATATPSPVPPTATLQPTLEPTATLVPPTSTPTTAPATFTASPAVPQVPVIGGADKIALLRNNDIWVMNVDGSELRSVTDDRSEKWDVQWLPDGNIIYIVGAEIKTVDVATAEKKTLASFASPEFLDAFRVSPDGKQVAISLNRELYILPFEPASFKINMAKSTLLAMNVCLFYNDTGVQNVLWSRDGQKLALKFSTPLGNSVADTIRILDVHLCQSSEPIRLDEFPATRFKFTNDIVRFDWDGNSLFALNGNIRNGGFGDLGIYDTSAKSYEASNPVDGNCCYRDAAFSPDGSYLVFAYQDINLGTDGPIEMYYLPVASFKTGIDLEPVVLPEGFFTQRNDTPIPILRPYKP